MINVSELINDPDFAQKGGINIIRRRCEIVNHLPVITEVLINLRGIITIEKDTSINMRETSDISSESIHVFTYSQLYTTGRTDDESVDNFLSDIVLWSGAKYKVMQSLDDAQYGFCRSTAEKIQQGVM